MSEYWEIEINEACKRFYRMNGPRSCGGKTNRKQMESACVVFSGEEMKPKITETTRVFIIDDHPIMRQGLKSLLESMGYEVCGEAATVEEISRNLSESMPGLIILDIKLLEENNLDLLQVGLPFANGVPVIIYSMHANLVLMEKAYNSGACGYVRKNDPLEVLEGAIRGVLLGKSFSSETLSPSLIDLWLQKSLGRKSSPFSPREKQVYDLLGKGFRPKVIAEKLVLSHKTIETVIGRLKIKVGVNTNSSLVRHAVSNCGNQKKKRRKSPLNPVLERD